MLVIGAMGFAKELLTVLEERDWSDIAFFDDVTVDPRGCIFENYRVLRDVESCRKRFSRYSGFVIGVGQPETRHMLFKKFVDIGGELCGITSADARIGSYNRIDPTCIIMPRVIIENDNRIGRATLLHVGAFVSHDISIGEFCEISPFAKLLGKCEIGNFCSIGTGAIVLPGVKLGDNVIVGAGSVVTRDVDSNCTVKGVPARVS